MSPRRLASRSTSTSPATGKPARPCVLPRLQLSGNDLSVLLAGDVADYAFNGDIKVKAASIAPFSELAGRQLSGALDMDAAGSIEPINGAFDLSIDSVASGLGIGSAAGRQSACRRYPHHGRSGARRRPGLSRGSCGSSTTRPPQRPMARSPPVPPTSTSISS